MPLPYNATPREMAICWGGRFVNRSYGAPFLFAVRIITSSVTPVGAPPHPEGQARTARSLGDFIGWGFESF